MAHEIYHEAVAYLTNNGYNVNSYYANEQSVAQIWIEGRTITGTVRVFPDESRNDASIYGTGVTKFITDKRIKGAAIKTAEDIIAFAKNVTDADRAMSKLLNLPELPEAIPESR